MYDPENPQNRKAIVAVLEKLVPLHQDFYRAMEGFVPRLQELIDLSEGIIWLDFEHNKGFAEIIQMLLIRFGCTAVCPKCGEDAKIRCRKTSGSKRGVFQFEHYSTNPTTKETVSTNHGGSSRFPAFKVKLLSSKLALPRWGEKAE